MNWDAIAAMGQMVGALALILVLVQVRHSREEMRRSLSQTRANAGRELWMLRAANPQLNDVLLRADSALGGEPMRFAASVADIAKVPVDEAMQVFSYHMAWWVFQAQVIPYANELLPGERAQFDRALRGFYGRSAAGRFWFENASGMNALNPDAVRYVEAVLARQSD